MTNIIDIKELKLIMLYIKLLILKILTKIKSVK